MTQASCDFLYDRRFLEGIRPAGQASAEAGAQSLRARKAYRLFEENPSHPSLEFKKVHQTKPVYSARVTLDYRAVGARDGNEIVWFWIGPHDEYERVIANV